jgi:arylsulfatase A-like enzyme
VKTFCWWTSLLLILPGTVAAESERTRPNIILLIADDLGYAELGCQGNTDIPAPHIDSLAERGVRFTNAYVTAPFCSASRAGLMTGRYQSRFGYDFNPIGADNEDPDAGLPRSERTLAEHLQHSGYATALIGKWHLGGTAHYHPIRRGFDEFFGFLHEGHYFVPPPYHGVTTMLRRRSLPDGRQGRWISADGRLVLSTHMGHHEPAYDANNPILRGGQPVVEAEYLTDAFTREAVDFITRHHERPFFLCLSYNAVHSPLQAKNEDVERFSHIEDIHRRIFAGMLHALDESVGAVLSRLRELELDENTLVFFLSDNGGPTEELTSSNVPLRDGKGSVYEGGLRVPFLMQWPARLSGGGVYEFPVLSLDILPTALAAAEGELDQSLQQRLDGVDLVPFLTGPDETATPHHDLFWRIGNRQAVRYRNWKLVRPGGRGASPESEWELYDLAEDISESHDLATEHPALVRELEARWQAWNDQMQDPFWKRQR